MYLRFAIVRQLRCPFAGNIDEVEIADTATESRESDRFPVGTPREVVYRSDVRY